MRIAGIPGALVATFSCIAPACLIVSLLAWLYFKYQNLAYIQGTLAGLRPAVVALIASAGVSILSLAVFGDGVASAAAFNWLGAGCLWRHSWCMYTLRFQTWQAGHGGTHFAYLPLC